MSENNNSGTGVYLGDEFNVKITITVRPDSQIPEFDSIDDIKFEVDGTDPHEKYTKKLIEIASENMGMFLEDVLKLTDKDIIMFFDPEVKSWDVFPIPALRAIKKAIYNYLNNTGQTERLSKYITRLVCRCRNVTDTEILDAARRFDADLEKVQRVTGAGLSCGSCALEVRSLVESTKSTFLGKI